MTKEQAIEILNATQVASLLAGSDAPGRMREFLEALATARAFTDGAEGRDFTELQAIACAAIVIADAGPGKTTGPMWTRLWSLLNDRVRRGLDEAMTANYGPGSAERRMTEQCPACRAPRGVLCRRDCSRLIEPSRPVATEAGAVAGDDELRDAARDLLQHCDRGSSMHTASAVHYREKLREILNRPARPVAACSKARAEEMLHALWRRAGFTPLTVIDMLDRANAFPDEATLAEIAFCVRNAEALARGDVGGDPAGLLARLATAVRKLGIGGGK